ncbi:hypothetical protein PG985_005520 [Apiospora marii]|uniref:uncharacterized protein n=1 Tax=Apiospora marii TaxID=335849 RepID=UPI00312E4866
MNDRRPSRPRGRHCVDQLCHPAFSLAYVRIRHPLSYRGRSYKSLLTLAPAAGGDLSHTSSGPPGYPTHPFLVLFVSNFRPPSSNFCASLLSAELSPGGPRLLSSSSLGASFSAFRLPLLHMPTPRPRRTAVSSNSNPMLPVSQYSPSPPVARRVLLSYFATVSALSQASIAVNLSRPLRGAIAPHVLGGILVGPLAVLRGARDAFEAGGGIEVQ